MTFTPVLYIATAVITHYVASFIQASLHRLVAHRKIGGPLRKNHLRYHHAIYSRGAMVSEMYIDEEKSLTIYYVIPAAILASVDYLLLPLGIFLVHISSLTLSFYAHVYVHVQYHLKNPWLKRFEWFRRKQQLHILHHKDGSMNFAVLEFFWDRVFGTYRGARVELKR